MRIITGKAKGIRLNTLEGDATRPTAERVKEAIFSMIQFDLEGRQVLDLFAGSGQLGLEAISRGAASAVLVDQSKQAVRIIQENAEKTKLAPYCTIRQAESLEFLRRCHGQRFDIVFLDPPYASNLYTPVLRALLELELLKPQGMIICESDFDELFRNDRELANCFYVKKQSRYSKTVITILAQKEAEE